MFNVAACNSSTQLQWEIENYSYRWVDQQQKVWRQNRGQCMFVLHNIMNCYNNNINNNTCQKLWSIQVLLYIIIIIFDAIIIKTHNFKGSDYPVFDSSAESQSRPS